MIESFQIKKKKKMGLMNYAISVDSDESVCPLKYIEQSLYSMLNTACTIYQRKYMHMLIWNYNGCCFYLERLVLFLCWVVSKYV